MTKHYRVKKDTFLWEEGAILQKRDGYNSYEPISDIWNKVQKQNEVISDNLIENNPDWFERVYQDTVKGNVHRTLAQMKKIYKDSFNQE